MSKRSIYTTITPLPPGVTRATVLETLHTHVEMIDLNPLVIERHPIKAPPQATPEEFHCQWYELTDKIQYLPGGLYSGKVSYTACFHDLANGVQTHVYAPMGLDIRGTWTIGGSLPGEPQAPVEMGKGIPLQGLYLREDTDLKCNVFLQNFVKKNLKNSHAALVARMVVKAQLTESAMNNDRMSEMTIGSSSSSPHLSYIHHAGSIHHRSPLASPTFPAQSPVPMYVDPRTQTPFQPGFHPYNTPPPPFDPRFSTQSGSSYMGSPGYQMDPAYANANPYMQQQGHMMYAPSHADSRQSFQPSELASNAPSETQDEKKDKGNEAKSNVGAGGPPSHPAAAPTSFAAELPADVPK